MPLPRRWIRRSLPILVAATAISLFAPVPGLVESVGAASESSAPLFDRGVVPEATVTARAIHLEDADEGHRGSDGQHVADRDEPSAGDAEQLAVGLAETEHEFHTIGVTMREESEVFVRVRSSDGDWQEWMSLAPDPSEGPDIDSPEDRAADPDARYATAPVWVEGATAYEVAVDEDLAASVEVLTVRDVPQLRVAVIDREAGAATRTPFQMHHRSEWTSRAPKEVNRASSVDMAVVHHSVTPNAYSPGQVPSRLRGIQKYHMDSRGWSDIGYNFAVDKYGGVWEARGGGYDQAVIGAHASGFNSGSVGIVVLGDYSSTASSGAANESVAQVAGWKLFRHDHNPAESATFTSGGGPRYPAGAKVTLPRMVGHTQVGSTACPGRVLNAMPGIRNRAQQIKDFLRASTVDSPKGSITSIATGPGRITVSATFSDPDGPGNRPVYLEISGKQVAKSNSSGKVSLTASGIASGRRQVCVRVNNLAVGFDARVDCRTVYIPTGDPIGAFISLSNPANGWIRVTGWAYDPKTRDHIDVVAITDTVWKRSVAKFPNTRTRASDPSMRKNRGFDFNVKTGVGNRTICMVAMNSGKGSHTVLGCRKMVVK